MQYIFIIILSLLVNISLFSQNSTLTGSIKSNSEDIEFVNITLENENHTYTTNSDRNGEFTIGEIAKGEYLLSISYIGFKTYEETLTFNRGNKLTRDIKLEEKQELLDQIVVTGTKTFKRKTNSAVLVNVIDNESLQSVQACNLAEGLRFQSGLRVETDCQTCNYTQLRINGLQGGYSQILFNGRPVFSPLAGLYGLEQIPVNMINRIEVVKGGGSSLYGTGAIGGTVNVITRTPVKNSYGLEYTYQNIGSQTHESIVRGNASVVTKNQNNGISFFVSRRSRGFYDANGDNFSEIPEIEDNSFGFNAFSYLTPDQKIELNFSSINEYRYGGEMVDEPAHLALQSEERSHNIIQGSADYQWNFNDEASSLILFGSGQITNRDHYTGIFPDDEEAVTNHLKNPPYGISYNSRLHTGVQLNHSLETFPGEGNTLTLGTEYQYDNVQDNIGAYNYNIDQRTKDFAGFLQLDWDLLNSFNVITGFRVDKHNLVDDLVFSPRASILYKLKNNMQFRGSWSTGFRAPQAFDTDLHIAFAGGGISRVQLSENLIEEKSQSLSASVNYDKVEENWIAGFTLEGFYTTLNDVFVLTNIGEDDFGQVFEKQNGRSASVAGATLELRANYNQKAQVQLGFTMQNSEYEEPVVHIEEKRGVRQFLRTPDTYGFMNVRLNPVKSLGINFNYIFTGSMRLAHFAGAPEQQKDEYKESEPFHEVSMKTSYTFPMESIESEIELFAGVKNIFNSYQSDFDTGKNRDSNYVYGPSLPRTIFLGIKLGLMD